MDALWSGRTVAIMQPTSSRPFGRPTHMRVKLSTARSTRVRRQIAAISAVYDWLGARHCWAFAGGRGTSGAPLHSSAAPLVAVQNSTVPRDHTLPREPHHNLVTMVRTLLTACSFRRLAPLARIEWRVDELGL